MEKTGEASGPGSQGEAAPGAEAPSGRKGLVKLLVFAAVVVGVLVAVHLSPIGAHLRSGPELRDRIRGMGALAPLVFMAAVAGLTAVGVPRLLFCVLAGATFGFAAGLLWVQVGTFFGYYVTFLLARWVGRDFVLRHARKLGRFARLLDRQSVWTVIMLRTLPMHGGLTNVFLGISSVGHVQFLVGTLVGTTLEAVAFTLIGSGVVQESFGAAMPYVGGALGVLVAAWLVLGSYLRRRRASTAGEGTSSEGGEGCDG